MISKQAEGKKLLKDALLVAAEARESKASNPQTVDATIGSLQDEDGQFLCYETVDSVLKNLPNNEFYTYSSSDGGKPFAKAVLKWVFQEQVDLVTSMMACKVVATPGGTGAISNAVYNSLDQGQTLLYPNVYWGPYANMAASNGLKTDTFVLLKNNVFNIDEFKEKCLLISKNQPCVTFIINDPCNNPSGYSLTEDELSAIIYFMNENPNISFSFIYDIAYLDYELSGTKKTREKLTTLTKCNENVIVSVAFSGSKTFAIYGMRLGAHIILSKDEQSVTAWYDSSCFLARTRWSNTSKAGISLVTKIANDNLLWTKMHLEIQDSIRLIRRRAQLFINEAKKEKLDLYPYGGGFFITIRCDNNDLVSDILKEEAIFVLTFDQSIRISIGALTSLEITGLAKRIKRAIEVAKTK